MKQKTGLVLLTLASGQFLMTLDADLEALEEAGASADVTRAVLDENEQARLDGLRTALAALALIALIGLFFASRIPTEQPGATPQRAAPQQA